MLTFTGQLGTVNSRLGQIELAAVSGVAPVIPADAGDSSPGRRRWIYTLQWPKDEEALALALLASEDDE